MVLGDHVRLIGMDKRDVSLRSGSHTRGKYVRLIGILIAVVLGRFGCGGGPGACDHGRRWFPEEYVRDIVSVHIDTKTCVVETMPNRGEVDGECC
jgi:hypothetical protein